ncbi:TPA: helix-turn-helix transcriptional regulator [Streptococcus suis]|nr:helix-turn-helix transcriptional regulator [Streptococcus suis]HEM5235977.1 helix-turn-helix transcriptional regulator [Streptococcus suis]HEM5243209.1 helix-turn-helix transcriptional regulator [Streptococcus suis]
MKISFAPLWSQLSQIGMTRKDFQNLCGIGSSTMTKLKNDDCVTTDTILKICNALECDANQVIVFLEEI